MQPHKFVFICGLHKSGTSILAKSIGQHPLINDFGNTGVPQDEGQHLQSVYPAGKVYGGMGKFGFAPSAHLTELSPLVTDENRAKLFFEWTRYWDLGKPVLLEKSPPNLIRTRFLQAMFPDSYFIVITRHPIATSFAIRKGWRINFQLDSLLKHWLHCHDIFGADKSFLKRVFIFKYEDFVQNPTCYLERIYSSLGLDYQPSDFKIRPGINEKYFERWKGFQNRLFFKPYANYVKAKYEKRVNQYGYSLFNLDSLDAE